MLNGVLSRKKKSWTNDKISIFLILFYYCGMLFNLFMKTMFRDVQAITILGNLFYLFFVIFYGVFVSCYIKKGVYFFVFSESLLFLLYILSFLQGNALRAVLVHNIAWSMGICIPLATVFYSIQNKEKLYFELYHVSEPLLLVEMIILFLTYGLNNSKGAYSISLSFLMMLPICIQIEQILCRFSWKRMMLILMALVSLILWGGARRIFLILVVYLLLKLIVGWQYVRFASQRIILFFLAIISFIICCIANLRGTKILTEMLSGRIVRLFLEGRIIYGSGRMELYKDAIDKICEKPWLGWGLCGGWDTAGSYPHNIFLELWLAFGIVIGSVVIVMLFVIILNAIKNKSGAERSMILLYVALSSELLVSGPVTEDVSFWILIALCFSGKKRNLDLRIGLKNEK